VSLEQLQSIMPSLDDAMAQEYLPHLNAAMTEAYIDTPLRQAAFLAQLAHESVELCYMEESWGPTEDQLGYEGREDLGNFYEGDGPHSTREEDPFSSPGATTTPEQARNSASTSWTTRSAWQPLRWASASPAGSGTVGAVVATSTSWQMRVLKRASTRLPGASTVGTTARSRATLTIGMPARYSARNIGSATCRTACMLCFFDLRQDVRSTPMPRRSHA
jgi:hypothetical protein